MKAITREEKIMSGENLTPITRKEMFLAKASGMDIETPTPITREEIFLSKIGGTGGGTSGATAYIVSSVDELPSNAVDGSMAIVGNDDIVGTWRFGYTLKTAIDHCYSQQEFEENIDNYFRPFNAKYTNENGEEIFITNFSCVEYHNADDSTEYYNGIQISEFNDAWMYNESRWGYNYESLQITILETPDEQVEQWVRENANKVYSLYTHENGQWVYKGEVV